MSLAIGCYTSLCFALWHLPLVPALRADEHHELGGLPTEGDSHLASQLLDARVRDIKLPRDLCLSASSPSQSPQTLTHREVLLSHLARLGEP